MRYIYNTDGRELEVVYDHYAQDKALRVNGIQMEPDIPEYVEINGVEFKGEDILDLLSPTVLFAIEKEILS
jgi:hypothetical protein